MPDESANQLPTFNTELIPNQLYFNNNKSGPFSLYIDPVKTQCKNSSYNTILSSKDVTNSYSPSEHDLEDQDLILHQYDHPKRIQADYNLENQELLLHQKMQKAGTYLSTTGNS